MTSLSLPVNTAQSFSLVPEQFQEQLIDNMTSRLSLQEAPPCLLRAPTGSGKTYVLCKVLANVCARERVVWFWFVPYVNLLNQTLDALISNASDLTPVLFNNGINQEPLSGQVLISTTQGVSRASWRKLNYHAGGGELTRTPAEYVALARSAGLSIGVVIDEAHIALDHATEFGHFVRWLDPRYLLLATATPKSDRISQFLDSAGMGSYESFNVSRDDVVRARLNKRYLEAVVYQLRDTTVSVADLKRTVLRQAWLRNQALKTALAQAGIPLVPLLLVQVENGKGVIEEAERDLIELFKVPPQVIGKHSADAPDPDLMGSIANDPSTEVLIFKQSAGTGFDAPRAFVLASLKAVSDADFAMQFIGRVMRVARQIRSEFPHFEQIPTLFNTAYIYLANAEAQKGYQQAIQVTDSVQTQLEGQVEKMARRVTKSGATVITNLPTNQPPLTHYLPSDISSPPNEDGTNVSGEQSTIAAGPTSKGAPSQSALFEQAELSELDELAPEQAEIRPQPEDAVTRDQWESILKTRGITPYLIRSDLTNVPSCLKREDRPTILDMDAIVRRVVTRLVLNDRHLKDAILAVRGRLQETEQRTELTKRTVVSDKVHIVVDRNRVASEARAAMNRLPQIEDADQRNIIETLAKRVTPRLQEALDDTDTVVDSTEFTRMARTAACWLIRTHFNDLEEGLYNEIANQAVTTDAAPIPDAMLFPSSMALPVSRKNLYGILPPSKDDLMSIEQHLLLEDRELLQDRSWRIGSDGGAIKLHTGRFDQSFSMNMDEQQFALALDHAPFVAWWFRNPDKKPYSVRLVRGEHRNFFYPDFVVCLHHIDGAEPLTRLIETKHDLKDARRKLKHTPQFYGKVLFLTRDGGNFHIVTDEGGVGESLDLGDLEALREALQRTAP